uniref:Signal sequence receptor subunit 2 n=1 Tax=Suricata suricatta TaxID=37032 RepID=A0A673SQE5_SURSU
MGKGQRPLRAGLGEGTLPGRSWRPYVRGSSARRSSPQMRLLAAVLLALLAVSQAEEGARLLASKSLLNRYAVEGRDLTLQYNLYNVGSSAALDVELSDDSFPPEDFGIVSGMLNVKWDRIAPASNVSHTVVLRPLKAGYFNFTSATVTYLAQEDGPVVVGFTSAPGQGGILAQREFDRRFSPHFVSSAASLSPPAPPGGGRPLVLRRFVQFVAAPQTCVVGSDPASRLPFFSTQPPVESRPGVLGLFGGFKECLRFREPQGAGRLSVNNHAPGSVLGEDSEQVSGEKGRTPGRRRGVGAPAESQGGLSGGGGIRPARGGGEGQASWAGGVARRGEEGLAGGFAGLECRRSGRGAEVGAGGVGLEVCAGLGVVSLRCSGREKRLLGLGQVRRGLGLRHLEGMVALQADGAFRLSLCCTCGREPLTPSSPPEPGLRCPPQLDWAAFGVMTLPSIGVPLLLWYSSKRKYDTPKTKKN